MKRLFLVAMCAFLVGALVVPAVAGKIVVNQSQGQTVSQGQVSVGGLSVSSQAYATGANQAYGIVKAPTFLSPTAGAASANTGSATTGSQLKYGNGFQTQGMTGGAVNNGGIYY